MRILFDQGLYDMRNKGNVALLQVAVTRLARMWPGASLEVITAAPHLLRLYCPQARPVSPDDQYDWTKRLALIDRILNRIPRPLLRLFFELREGIWRYLPGSSSVRSNARLNRWQRGNPEPHIAKREQEDKIHAVMSGVDLFVATGSQYMSDACRDSALSVLERLEAAHQAGIPTVMVGQGLGPFEDPELRSRVKAVFPLVNLICFRDKRMAGPLSDSLGVGGSHLIFTGDDAIEMAYGSRTSASGTAIGVSLRVADYTQMGANDLELIRSVLHEAALKHTTKLIAVPISHSAHELDDRVLRQLLARPDEEYKSRWKFDTPVEVIKKVGRCRLVVTGTFHAAVFALSQGIPAICMAKSRMYADKFLSLADQFGPGCQVVCLDDKQVGWNLEAAIDRAWETAERVRPQLLEAATRQIELGHKAYRRLYDLVESEYRLKQNQRRDECVTLSHA